MPIEERAELKVPCKTKDGEIVPVALDVIRQARTFDQMYRDLDLEGHPSFVFPVGIKAQVFKKVVEWCKNHVGQCVDEPTLKEDPSTRERVWFELNDFEKEFFDVPADEVAELMTAGNYLDIKSLYLFGCQSLAVLFKGKSPQEIRNLMSIERDLTEEEENEIKKANVWCNY